MNEGILGDYVELIRRKNKDLITDTLVGVDINKNLIEEKIRGEKTNLRTLQIVEKGDFVMSGMNVGRDRRIPVALYTGDNILGASGSNKYYVFRVKDPNLIISEFLNLIFKSQKIDLIGLYFSGKGVRGELEWNNFCSIPIYIPPLELQKRIVKKYSTLERIIRQKREINEKLERWMQSLFHIWFDNLEENQYSYKTFGELFTIIRGGRPPRGNREQEQRYFCKEGGIPWLQVGDISKKGFKFISETSEQLTPEGFKRGRCAKILPGGGIFFSSTMLKKNKLKT